MTETPTTEADPQEPTTKTKFVTPWPIDQSAKFPNGDTMPQIHRALFAAKLAMPEIAKNGKMSLGGKEVPFTKIDDIRATLYPILEQYGVMTYLMFVDQETHIDMAAEPLSMMQFSDELDAAGNRTGTKVLLPSREIRDGKIPTTRFRVQVVYDVQFIFVGDNSGAVVRVIGEAMDTSSDKATGKATTAAVKRAFVETFGIVDRMERDIESDNPEDANRSATTDRREGGDRGQQARATAQTAGVSGTTRRSGPQAKQPNPNPSAAVKAAVETGADTDTGELPEPAAPPEPTTLDAAKARVRAANEILRLTPAEVGAIVTNLTGLTEREGENGWITKVTAVKKLADDLETRVKAQADQ